MRLALIALATLVLACSSDDADPGGGAGGSGGGGGSSASGGSAGASGGGGGTAGGSGGAAGQGGAAGAAPTTKVKQITHRGITWHFAAEVDAGQFITGDYWVVAPVTISAVDPAPAPGRNGSEQDPKPKGQGYDDRGGNYDATRALTFPLTVTGASSIVSSESKVSGEFKNNGVLVTQSVLTVLTAPPPADAFRPPYAPGNKDLYTWGQVDLGKLPKLAPPTAPTTAADVAARVTSGPRIDHIGNWTIQHSCAEGIWGNYSGKFGGCYGREVGALISEAAVLTLVDVPERQDIVRGLIQIGIDNYGVLRAGGSWAPDGGHHNGRKFPILFAGALLGDAKLSAMATDFPGDALFGEDGQTYQGNGGKALFGKAADPKYFLAGCSGSGAKDARDPAGLVDGCPDYRNCCTSSTWVGEALAAHHLGLVTAWKHQPFFDYVDRWMSGDVQGGGSAQTPFAEAMWKAHR